MSAFVIWLTLMSVASQCGSVLHWMDGTVAATGRLEQRGQGYPPCDPSVQYSGYFSINKLTDKNYFFWAFESRGNPLSDPVILWMTGGPGCSSGLAVLAENGPCKVDDSLNVTNNPYSWNNAATVIYIDQPAGVGFSYSDSDGYDDNEEEVAGDMYRFMQAFYLSYPRFLTNELFVYGESYGGHFAPATAHRIWKGNQDKEGVIVPLKGLSVGNGFTVPPIQYNYYAELAYHWCTTVKGEPCVTTAVYQSMIQAQPECTALILQCELNQTNTSCNAADNFCDNAQMNPYMDTNLNPYDIRIPCEVPGLCYNFSNIHLFFNRVDVQKSLGVYDQNITWSSCNFQVNGMFNNDWMQRFDTEIPDLLNNGIRVLIYAGDMDFICNWIGNKAWTMALEWSGQVAFNNATDEPWYLDLVEAGRVRSVSSNTTQLLFSFVQIHGAGHMVPMDQPHRALSMVEHFLADRQF